MGLEACSAIWFPMSIWAFGAGIGVIGLWIVIGQSSDDDTPQH